MDSSFGQWGGGWIWGPLLSLPLPSAWGARQIPLFIDALASALPISLNLSCVETWAQPQQKT